MAGEDFCVVDYDANGRPAFVSSILTESEAKELLSDMGGRAQLVPADFGRELKRQMLDHWKPQIHE